jgi:hypothetical protein
MHQTTVRFGPDLWRSLEQEAHRLGVSVAQYVRDSALARLAYTQGLADGRSDSSPAWAALDRPDALSESVLVQLDSAAAVKAQGRIARARAQRADASQIRRRVRSAGS